MIAFYGGCKENCEPDTGYIKDSAEVLYALQHSYSLEAYAIEPQKAQRFEMGAEKRFYHHHIIPKHKAKYYRVSGIQHVYMLFLLKIKNQKDLKMLSPLNIICFQKICPPPPLIPASNIFIISNLK